MLHHGRQRDGQNGEQRADEGGAAVNGEQPHGLLVQGQTEPGGAADGSEVHRTGDQRHRVGNQHAQQDGQDLDHALAPDVAHHHGGQRHDGQQPVGGAVGNGGGSQNQADGDDDGTGDHRGEELHDAADAEGGNQQADQQVQQTAECHRRAGVGQHLGVGLAVDHGGHDAETAQIGKAGAKEGRDLALGDEMEQQRAQTGAQQRGGHAQTGEQRHQHGGAEHGEHVLSAKDEQPGRAQLFGIKDALRIINFLAHGNLLYSRNKRPEKREATFCSGLRFSNSIFYHTAQKKASKSVRFFPFLSKIRHRAGRPPRFAHGLLYFN